MKKLIFFLPVLSLFYSSFCLSQVGIGTITPTATLEIQEDSGVTEEPILRLTTPAGRSMSILQPDNGDDTDPFTFHTNNAYDFRVDGTDVFTIRSNGNIGINETNPQTTLHLGNAGSTMRLDYLNSTNNANNNGTDPTPLYVNSVGELTTQPAVTQTYMAVNDLDFSPGAAITSSTGAAISGALYTRSITLTQESLVHISYQISVSVTRSNGSQIEDGGTRLFRSGIRVNSVVPLVAYDTGSHTNYDPGGGPPSTYVSDGYYLSGSGYVQLPSGTHDFILFVLGDGGDFDYRITYAATTSDRFQVVVHR